MSFDMNSGYCGWSMSRNAAAAYDDGEAPRSRWTKRAMLAALADACDRSDLVPLVDFSKLKRDELFAQLFEYRGWHHTSKFCNVTEFYGLDEDALAAVCRDMSAAEIDARDSAREKAAAEEKARQDAARAAVIELRRREQAYFISTGFRPDTVAAYAKEHPERCSLHKSKRSGRLVIDYTDPVGRACSCLAHDAEHHGMLYFCAVKEG